MSFFKTPYPYIQNTIIVKWKLLNKFSVFLKKIIHLYQKYSIYIIVNTIIYNSNYWDMGNVHQILIFCNRNISIVTNLKAEQNIK